MATPVARNPVLILWWKDPLQEDLIPEKSNRENEKLERTWVEKLGISLLPLQLGPKANFSVKC